MNKPQIKKLRVPIILSIIGCILGGFFLYYGIPMIIQNIHDPYMNNITELKKPQSVTYPYHYYDQTLSIPFFSNVTLTFTTDDTFSVGNYISGNLTVNTPLSFNVQEFGVISVTSGSKFPILDSNNTKLIQDELNTLEKVGSFLHLWHLHNMPDNSYSYIVQFGTIPTSEDSLIIIGVAQICDVNSKSCIWIHTPPYKYPTIYPYTAKLQAETNRAIQRQALESETANNLIEGLTLLLAGLVPVGLVLEFWIEYAIENHFYRDEKPKTVTKIEPWNCDFFPDNENSK